MIFSSSPFEPFITPIMPTRAEIVKLNYMNNAVV